MHDYIYYYCMHLYSMEWVKLNFFTKHISRNTLLMVMYPLYIECFSSNIKTLVLKIFALM